MSELLGETESLCPECLWRIPARRISENGNIYLEKNCPEHGKFKVLIWRQTVKHYLDWGQYLKKPTGPLKSLTNLDQGCPYDCGVCPDHQTNACSMVMEVTQKCNLRCPVCLASGEKKVSDEPSLQTIREMYQTVLETAGTPPIQLSGGEPTVRDDLAEIVALGKEMGFRHIMLNTNGIRIAKDKDYLQRLVDSGASTVYLQFDGITDDVYRYSRGANLFRYKVKAINNCAQAKIGVILVPTVIPKVNDHQLGDIIQFAKQWIPAVKGIHFQPVTYMGRYPKVAKDDDRITMPELIEALVKQTKGELKPEDFMPNRCGGSHCAFSSLFVLAADGQLFPISSRVTEKLVGSLGFYKKSPEESARLFLNLRWQFSQEQSASCCEPGCCGTSFNPNLAVWAEVYQQVAAHGLTITCMPFQDVWDLDVERLERCCVHVVTPEKRIIPFCAYYLTSARGQKLYSQALVQTASTR